MTTLKTFKKHLCALTAIFLLASLFLIYTAHAAPRYIDNRYEDYFLSGTVEDSSDFNFNLGSGQSSEDSITIVNNSESVTKNYSLTGIDTETNNQQRIVFKSVAANNPNIGKWLILEKEQVDVPPKSHVTIPFKIQIPEGTYPGTYFGGVSITKINTAEKTATENDIQSSNMGVNVQTRIILDLKVNVAGTLSKTFQVDNFRFDSKKNSFLFTVNNTGNVLLAIEGNVLNQTNLLGNSESTNLPLNKFVILPGSSVTEEIKAGPTPLFGEFKASLEGKVSYFNGVINQYEEFDSIKAQTQQSFFNWTIIITGIGLLLLLIILILLTSFFHKKYTKECSEYIVQEGDTLETIAKEHNMNWKKLARINKLHAPYAIVSNQKILVHDKKIN